MTLGVAPVLDFDGTMARLGVDWATLRQRLHVARINELWARGGEDWSVVADAEIDAAGVAPPIAPVVALLSTVRRFTVLTSNDAAAVHRFVGRFPSLQHRLALVVGRQELGGPKTDFTRFETGVRKCLAASGQEQTADPAVYVGDSQFELDFAQRLGLKVIDVKDLLDA